MQPRNHIILCSEKLNYITKETGYSQDCQSWLGLKWQSLTWHTHKASSSIHENNLYFTTPKVTGSHFWQKVICAKHLMDQTAECKPPAITFISPSLIPIKTLSPVIEEPAGFPGRASRVNLQFSADWNCVQQLWLCLACVWYVCDDLAWIFMYIKPSFYP